MVQGYYFLIYSLAQLAVLVYKPSVDVESEKLNTSVICRASKYVFGHQVCSSDTCSSFQAVRFCHQLLNDSLIHFHAKLLHNVMFQTAISIPP